MNFSAQPSPINLAIQQTMRTLQLRNYSHYTRNRYLFELRQFFNFYPDQIPPKLTETQANTTGFKFGEIKN